MQRNGPGNVEMEEWFYIWFLTSMRLAQCWMLECSVEQDLHRPFFHGASVPYLVEEMPFT